jgi:hypothetical protein
MNLGKANSTIAQLHPSRAFELPPPTPAMHSAQSFDLPDLIADCYGLNIGDFTNDFEAQRACNVLPGLVPPPVQPGEDARGVAAVAAGPVGLLEVPDEVLVRVGGALA